MCTRGSGRRVDNFGHFGNLCTNVICTMAILGKITVQILVNGQALQEYADHELIEENSNVAEKHVEATTGAPFAIKLSVADPSQIDSDALSFIIHLDGKLIQSTLLRKAKFSEQFMLWEQIVHGVTTNGPSTAKMKPFLFSEITCCKSLTRFT